MIRVRPAAERGGMDRGWLDTRHTFSFANYMDPQWMGFRTLRVVNEDWIAPGAGFPMHPHQDMEIVTIPLEGALEHRDSLGNGSVIRAGEVQRMTAGTGILHSESNPVTDGKTHLYQIWILPEKQGLTPSYDQKELDPATRRNRLQVVASRDGRDGSITINQDTSLYLASLAEGAEVRHGFDGERFGWVQVMSGSVEVNGETLSDGDGAAVGNEGAIRLKGLADGAEVMLFDMP